MALSQCFSRSSVNEGIAINGILTSDSVKCDSISSSIDTLTIDSRAVFNKPVLITRIDSIGGIGSLIRITSGLAVSNLIVTPRLVLSTESVNKATLSSGTVTVTDVVCSPSSFIFVSYTGSLSNPGFLSVVAGVNTFTVTSSNSLDASSFNWFVLNTSL